MKILGYNSLYKNSYTNSCFRDRTGFTKSIVLLKLGHSQHLKTHNLNNH